MDAHDADDKAASAGHHAKERTGDAFTRSCSHGRFVMFRAATGDRPNLREGPFMVCLSCGAMRLARSFTAVSEVFHDGDFGPSILDVTTEEATRRTPQGAALRLCRVKGHPRSLPTHPSRWT